MRSKRWRRNNVLPPSLDSVAALGALASIAAMARTALDIVGNLRTSRGISRAQHAIGAVCHAHQRHTPSIPHMYTRESW